MARSKDNPHSRELRQRLLNTAGEVFAEHGFRAATVREITERAGVNLAAINYHFSDKAELYASVLRAAHCKAMECLVPDAQGPPRERLRAFVAAMLTFLLDPARPPWQNRLLARELADPTPALESIMDGMRARSERLKTILRDLAGADLPTEKLALMCCSIMGQCIHYSQSRTVIERIHPVLDGIHERIDALAGHITEFSTPAVKQAGRRAVTLSDIPLHERRPNRDRRTPRRKNDAPRKARR